MLNSDYHKKVICAQLDRVRLCEMSQVTRHIRIANGLIKDLMADLQHEAFVGEFDIETLVKEATQPKFDFILNGGCSKSTRYSVVSAISKIRGLAAQCSKLIKGE